MSPEFLLSVDSCSTGALASGALQPLDLDHVVLDDDGLKFVVRWPSSEVQKKDVVLAPPGGPRDPNFNPFLPPDPELTVGPVGRHHTAILNKFPVSPRHLVLARTKFQEQQTGMASEDFHALAAVMSACGGVGFFNGGTAAGASQRHKHVQWIPQMDDHASLRLYTDVFSEGLDELTLVAHPGLPMRHCFVRVSVGEGVPAAEAAASMNEAYTIVLKQLGLHADKQGFVPPFNLLVEDGWMLVVPRSQEHYEDISVNSVSYGGVLHVERPDQVETIRRVGPLAVLAAAAHPA